ncbi:MAG: Gfo/Idh/MocA family oxidoreductase [Pirellula sp.]|nr:Gfo/Idh/MocA family oxidoreductase [Pirellula sp.]
MDQSESPATPANCDSRRDFIKTTSTVIAGGAMIGTLPIARAAHSFSSDEIKIGLVGCGGRGTGAATQALDTISAENRLKLTAVADPFQSQIDNSLRSMNKKHGEHIDVTDRIFVGVDGYKRLLESDIDMVILATPPGFRPMHFEAAIKAGKHVFMEKPVATDAPGVRRVLAANKIAKEKNLVVAVGLQRHHESGYQATIAKLKDGAIGNIVLARAYWNNDGVWTRNRTPDQSELEYQINNWYYFNWLCGDHICEQHIHNLDVINWLMDGPPVEAQGQGGRQVRTGPNSGQIFDHHFVEYTYGNGVKLLSQCRHIPGTWSAVSEFAHGANGWCDIGAGRIYDRNNKEIWRAPANEQGHAKEHFDLFASIRKGEVPNEGDYGATSTMTSIMGRMATYTGKRLTWDQCLNSKVSLANTDALDSFKSEAPIQPENGKYWVPTPGVDPELVV